MLDGVGVRRLASPALPRKRTPVPITQEAELAHEAVQEACIIDKIYTPSPGYKPRTIEPVVSRYSDYALLAPCQSI